MCDCGGPFIGERRHGDVNEEEEDEDEEEEDLISRSDMRSFMRSVIRVDCDADRDADWVDSRASYVEALLMPPPPVSVSG